MWLAFSMILCALTGWIGHAVWLDAYGRREPGTGRWDAAVVPGAAVLADGSPSGALARRVSAAVDLWRQGRVERIVLTGGVGRHPPAEGDVAAALCATLGVPPERLVVERRSVDTLGNAAGAATLLGPAKVVVVTDGYHCFRCQRMFRRHFAEVATCGTRPPARSRVRMALRESASVTWHGLRGRL